VHPALEAVRDVVARALAEDVLPLGDLTASLVPADATARAAFVAREAGVLAGRLCAVETLRQVDERIEAEWRLDDGDTVQAGAVIGRVHGPLRGILTAERTALNLLCRLSGIATLTRRFAEAASPARIRDTRKTTPGLRALEKAAVRAGGGFNHRAGLSDGILVKDNHLAGLGIAAAVKQAHERWPGRTVEVECETLEQVQEALDAGADMILLEKEHLTTDQKVEASRLIGGRVPVEVSGGVTLENVADHRDADYIAVGAITHSAPILDIGLDLL